MNGIISSQGQHRSPMSSIVLFSLHLTWDTQSVCSRIDLLSSMYLIQHPTYSAIWWTMGLYEGDYTAGNKGEWEPHHETRAHSPLPQGIRTQWRAHIPQRPALSDVQKTELTNEGPKSHMQLHLTTVMRYSEGKWNPFANSPFSLPIGALNLWSLHGIKSAY